MTNAALQAAITANGDKIFAFFMEDHKTILANYGGDLGGMIVKTDEVTFKTYGGVDFVIFKQSEASRPNRRPANSYEYVAKFGNRGSGYTVGDTFSLNYVDSTGAVKTLDCTISKIDGAGGVWGVDVDPPRGAESIRISPTKIEGGSVTGDGAFVYIETVRLLQQTMEPITYTLQIETDRITGIGVMDDDYQAYRPDPKNFL
jgi:hypothetical protein